MIIRLTIKSKQNVFSHPVGQKSILKISKLAKMANFSVESGSESDSCFIGPLQDSECHRNISFHENSTQNSLSFKV